MLAKSNALSRQTQKNRTFKEGPVTEHRVKVPIQGTTELVDGVEVQVDVSTERWSEFTLEDGTILKVKMSIVSAVRVEGVFDPAGNPQYVLNIAPVVAMVSSPEAIRKKVI